MGWASCFAGGTTLGTAKRVAKMLDLNIIENLLRSKIAPRSSLIFNPSCNSVPSLPLFFKKTPL